MNIPTKFLGHIDADLSRPETLPPFDGFAEARDLFDQPPQETVGDEHGKA